ncbi:hypothetical protein [Aeromonas caviae]|nr:hypothetical protein [Aeromonas caviae]
MVEDEIKISADIFGMHTELIRAFLHPYMRIDNHQSMEGTKA